MSRKLVPQRGCSREKRCAFSGVRSQPRLVAGDRLVLGAVVLEDAAQRVHPRDEPEVAEEDRDADQLLDDDEDDRVRQRVLEEARDADRDEEEEADRERDRRARRCPTRRRRRSPRRPRRAGRSRRSRGRCSRCAATRRARRRRARRAAAAARCRRRTETSGKLAISISPVAGSPGSRLRPEATCSGWACGRRRPTSTRRASSLPRGPPGPRWVHRAARRAPPPPARPCADSGQSPGWRFAARRLKRSTRPPVSTIRCLPV